MFEPVQTDCVSLRSVSAGLQRTPRPHHPENCGLYKIRRLGWRRLRQLAKRLSRTPAHPLSSPKIAAYTEFAGRAGEGLRKPSPTISPNTNLQTSNCTENNYVFCTSSKNSRYLYAWRYQ